jgi:drug/metabolite transporter (DMT)-like permease
MLFMPAYLLTEGIRQTSATLAALMGLLSIPIAGLLACLFFHDERRAVRNRRFLLGAGLAFLGALVVALGPGNLNLTYSTGVLYIFAATVLYVAAALLSKRLVRNIHPLSLATLCCCWSSLLFLGGTLLRGDITQVAEVPGKVVFWLIFSGVVGLTAGVAINFALVKRRGIITVKVAELAIPLFTGLWSYLWLNEELKGVQILGGCVVALGCATLLSSRPQTAPPPMPD